jgi:hypothetical protein
MQHDDEDPLYFEAWRAEEAAEAELEDLEPPPAGTPVDELAAALGWWAPGEG